MIVREKRRCDYFTGTGHIFNPEKCRFKKLFRVLILNSQDIQSKVQLLFPCNVLGMSAGRIYFLF